jgi:hypothetical protein
MLKNSKVKTASSNWSQSNPASSQYLFVRIFFLNTPKPAPPRQLNQGPPAHNPLTPVKGPCRSNAPITSPSRQVLASPASFDRIAPFESVSRLLYTLGGIVQPPRAAPPLGQRHPRAASLPKTSVAQSALATSSHGSQGPPRGRICARDCDHVAVTSAGWTNLKAFPKISCSALSSVGE